MFIDSYGSFKEQFYKLTGIDLNAYKEGQMRRRIDSLIAKNRIPGYTAFINVLKSDKEKYDEFLGYITINVSEFWRNPEQWEILERNILPPIINDSGIKVWSAACSTGDEPYSLAMLLGEFLPLNRINILATDIDKQVISKGRSGIYTEKSIKGLPARFRNRYVNHMCDGAYEVSQEIRKCVAFREHDLLSPRYPLDFDMIVCRNVLIYFTDEAKDVVFHKFSRSLKPGGILFLGSTEQILYPKDYGFSPISSFFYKKL
jgi:chemotaxis protein methyltransferase CheR